VNVSPLEPPVNTSFESFGTHQLDSCLCVIREVAEMLAQYWVPRHLLTDTRVRELRGIVWQ